MPIFRFDPVSETFDNPRWEASKIREPFWIMASSEDEARQKAALTLIAFTDRRIGEPTVFSPWLDPDYAECSLDRPAVDVPDGIIVTLAGRTHS